MLLSMADDGSTVFIPALYCGGTIDGDGEGGTIDADGEGGTIDADGEGCTIDADGEGETTDGARASLGSGGGRGGGERSS